MSLIYVMALAAILGAVLAGLDEYLEARDRRRRLQRLRDRRRYLDSLPPRRWSA